MRKATIILLALVMSTCSQSPGTLEEILETGQLRVLTRISPTTYYSGANGFEGPEHDLAVGFGRYLELKYNTPIRVQFVAENSLHNMLGSLRAGEMHLAAAGLTITDERQQHLDFGPAYEEVSQHLIYRLNSGKPKGLDDLRGKQLEILAGSSFAETLAAKRAEHPDLAWIENPRAGVSDLLLAVQDEKLDYTVVDSTAYKVHRYYMPDLRKALTLKTDDHLAWAFPKGSSDKLLADAREYFVRIEVDGTLAQIRERYYGHTEKFDYVGTRAFKNHYDTRLTEYRELFMQAGEETNTDWRLLAAIGYQESHWDPEAISPTGVQGLMMLTRVTAGVFGVENRYDAEESIAAGALYFDKLYQRLKKLPEPDRIWFALAAYNVGYGHVQDARRLARREGLDPNSWVVVREMLPRLAQRKYYETVPHGYARGWQPVRYVNNVRTYYEILNWLTIDEPEKELLPSDDGLIEEPVIQTASNEALKAAYWSIIALQQL